MHATLEEVLYFLYRSADKEDNAPFQNYLTKEGKVSKVNSYTAYQSPLLEGETLSRGSYCSETIPSNLGLL